VPKAAYCSDFRENTNFCPQRDSNLGSLSPQASVLLFGFIIIIIIISIFVKRHEVITSGVLAAVGCVC